MEILFQPVSVKHEFQTGTRLYHFDITFSHSGRNLQTIVIDRNIEVLAKALYKMEGRMDRELKSHSQV